jgi:hypothetical protein
MKKIILYSFVLAGLLTFANSCYAQDSLKFIILSKDVGSVVDLEERKEYNIFPTFAENFVSAYFYQSSDSQYYCSLKLQSDGFIKDSIIKHNYFSIRNIATRIQYQESQRAGRKDFNLDNVVLVFADGNKAMDIPQKQGNLVIKEKKSKYTLQNLPINKVDMDYSEIIEKKFVLGLSAGYILHNSTEYEGLGEIFNIIEEKLSNEIYSVPKTNLSFEASSLFRFSSLFIYKKHYMGEVVYTLSPPTDEQSPFEYKSFSISLSYLFTFLKNLTPYASLGYSASKFTAYHYYGIYLGGGTLESITLEGNVKGIMLSLGVLYNFTSNVAINLFGNYKFYPEVAVKTQDYYYGTTVPTVDAKGFEIGLSFNLTN